MAHPTARLVLCASALAALTACGGGDGDSGTTDGAGSGATAPVTPPAPIAALSRVNDTGITAQQCFAEGNVFVACDSAEARQLSSQQDGQTGRDADGQTNASGNGRLGFQFTAMGDCVRDDVTGLIWDRKSRVGPLAEFRDPARTFTNYGDGRVGDASAYVAALNAAAVCGRTDWRLPAADDMRTLVDFGVRRSVASDLRAGTSEATTPWIDSTWFPDTAVVYWTVQGRDRVFRRQLAVDRGFNYPYTNSAVWPVSGTSLPTGAGRFATVAATADETTDLQTGLVWKRCPVGTRFETAQCVGTPTTVGLNDAFRLATREAATGSGAWRLPNVKELESLSGTAVGGDAPRPAAGASAGLQFWSSTPAAADDASIGLTVVTDSSAALESPRTAQWAVRLVRNP